MITVSQCGDASVGGVILDEYDGDVFRGIFSLCPLFVVHTMDSHQDFEAKNVEIESHEHRGVDVDHEPSGHDRYVHRFSGLG